MNGRYFAADASVIVHVIAMMVVAMVVADSCVRHEYHVQHGSELLEPHLLHFVPFRVLALQKSLNRKIM